MSTSGPPQPDPDGRHDDLAPDEVGALDALHIPADASALEADRLHWLAEQRGRGRHDIAGRPGWRSPLSRHRERRLALTAFIVAIAMAVVAVSGVVGAVVFPSPPSQPAPAPLAEPLAEPGEVGGLLPDTTLVRSGAPPIDVPSRAVRPAVLALVPADCEGCPEVVAEVRRQAAEFGLGVTLVGRPDQAEQLAGLARSLGNLRLTLLLDPDAVLSDAFSARTLDLVLVRDNGLIVQVVRDPSPTVRLESALVQLVPGAGAGLSAVGVSAVGPAVAGPTG